MKKIIFSTLFAFIAVMPLSASAGVPEAAAYLKTQALDDWSAQGLVAAGETIDAAPLKTFAGSSVTDYAKRIMALVAAGKNPTNYTGADLVTSLRSFEQGGQLGDMNLLNDDAWGIMGLRSAGVSANEALIKNSAQFLVDNQNSDGGWSWSIGFDSDTNDTAAVLMALVEAGYTSSDTVIQKAVAYLATQQNADAGFPYQLPCFWPGCEASDSASTSWVISALNKLKLEPASWEKSGASPQDFLLSLQTGEGSFKWQAADLAGNQAMTVYAVVALSNKSYPVVRGNYSGGSGNSPTPLADLALDFTAENIIAEASQQTGLTLKLVNKGPSMAQAVVVELAWPEGMELVQTTASDGIFDKEKNKWTFIRLNNYATAELAFIMVARQATAGEIKASASARELDIDESNNEAIISFTAHKVEAEPSIEAAEESGEVLGEAAYSCEPALSADQSMNWPGYILSTSQSITPWYIDPVGTEPYCLSDSPAAYAALERFGLGITNADLARLPAAVGEPATVEMAADDSLVQRLKGRILLQVESLGEAWYVNPKDGLRYYLAGGQQALKRLFDWRVVVRQ